MGFFDDVVSGIGSVAGAVGGFVDKVPGLENLVPFGSTISAVGALARGGVAGLAGNLIGRAQTIAPVAATILGVPQLGGIAAGLFGGLRNVVNPGALAVGGNPTVPYGSPAAGGGMNPALLNTGRSQLPTTLALRDPMTGAAAPYLPGRTTLSIGGPLGLNFGTGGGFTGGGSPSVTNVGGGSCYSGPLYFGSTRSQLLKSASANAGFRITWKKLLYILLSFGIEVAKRFTGLDESAILWLYTTRPHRGRRGPHLRTIAKRARQVQGYRHSIARIARVLGAVRHHSFSRPPARRRRARR